MHYSSGVANHFFFMLAVGSGNTPFGNSPTCSGAPAVTGIGNAKAGAIWYRALTVYMTNRTNYKGARTATLNRRRTLRRQQRRVQHRGRRLGGRERQLTA